MKRDFSFGKVDGYHNGRRTCEVILNFGFQEFANQEPYFSVCGELWNNIHSDIIWGGQCVDSLAEQFKSLRNNKLYMEMLDLWKKYHLKKISAIPSEDVARINQIVKGVAI